MRHCRYYGIIRFTRQPECFQTRSGWGISQRRAAGALNPTEQSIRDEILKGLLTDKGSAAQMSTTMRVLAEIIASDVSLLATFNLAIEGVIQNNQNQKARQNPIEHEISIGKVVAKRRRKWNSIG